MSERRCCIIDELKWMLIVFKRGFQTIGNLFHDLSTDNDTLHTLNGVLNLIFFIYAILILEFKSYDIL